MKTNKQSKIVLEYHSHEAVKVKRVPLKGAALSKARKNGHPPFNENRTKVKNPKAWRVVYTENHVGVVPGQFLDQAHVKLLCNNISKVDVVIGEQGFFSKDNRW
tara:strand:+ start:2271 stop:2582 length:312 start_codon:yes stop_codon:yes gene_type:complete